MINSITLTSSMRSNLMSLKQITGLLNKTQNILSTGKDVNSALDNATGYYQARSLTNRAADLNNLLDGMGQAIQTISAATQGIESAAVVLEQMSAAAEQTLSNIKYVPYEPEIEFVDNAQRLIDEEGYTAITSSMTAAQIQNILNTDGAKVVLTEDVSISSGLSLSGKNIVINGGGHTLNLKGYINNSGSGATFENLKINSTYSATTNMPRVIYSSAGGISIRNVEIALTGGKEQAAGLELRGTATVENVKINMSSNSDQVIGVYAWAESTISNVSASLRSSNVDAILAAVGTHSSKVTIDKIGVQAEGRRAFGVIGTVKGIETSTVDMTSRPQALYDGKANTAAVIDEIGANGLAATAANQFYVGDKDGEFGQGTWYLPTIVDWMEVYGTDMSDVTAGWGSTSGATGVNKAKINTALTTLKNSGVEAEALTNGYYWSSSESFSRVSWTLYTSNGNRDDDGKDDYNRVRCFQLLKNCFNPLTLSDTEGGGGTSSIPEVGYVMYDDKTWGKANDYAAAAASGKIAVGVITEVNETDGSVKIMNLKNLTFGSQTATGNFDPENPYNNTYSTTRWSTGSDMYKDIQGIENYVDYELVLAVNPEMPVVTVEALNAAFAELDVGYYEENYNDILNQYDGLVNDAGYNGKNLLRGENADVRFNEDGSSAFNISGQDISSDKIGLNHANWTYVADIAKSVSEIKQAVSSLRSLSSELGNNYSIITNRQEFTENLINVLTEGSDKLVLADMNEASAEYLMLQTRQQLAVNSLSLASQSAQGLLKLF